MGQEVKVDRKLIIRGDAAQEPNVQGDLDLERRYRAYDFMELDIDVTNIYTINEDTTSTVDIGAGGCVLTTAGTDNKVASIACGGIFAYCAKNVMVEFTFQLNAVTNVAINAGFSDATSEGAGKLPMAIAGSTLTDNCTDGAMFVFDTDQTLDYWNIANTKNGTQGFTQLASTYVPVNATDVTLRVSLDSTGKAYYYYNGVQVGVKAAAVTAATPLVPFFGIKNMSGSAHVATLKSVRLWSDM